MRLFDRMGTLRPLAPYLVLVFFIISVAFSALSSDPGAITMWVLFGLLGVIFLKVAFPRSYLYGLWLLTIYILAGVGVLFLNGVGLTGGQGIGVGILLEIIAIYIVYHLIFQVKGLRDIGEGPYVPLGLWSMAVILFFIFSNGAMASLVGWANADAMTANLGNYVAFEVMIVLLVVFIFVKAEECVLYLEEGPRAIRDTAGAPKHRPRSTRAARARTAARARSERRGKPKKVKADRSCPICRSELKVVRRKCPECSSKEETAVCTTGHAFIPCPSCGTANFHGDYRCKNCNAKLSESILCTKCGTESDLQLWRKLKLKTKSRS